MLPEVDGVEVEMREVDGVVDEVERREVDGVVDRELFALDEFPLREAVRSPDV